MNDNSFVKRLSQYPRPVALLVCIALQLIVFLTSDIRYETNDDLYMNLITSGFLGGQPDAHLPYSHFLIGKLLSQLYLWNTSLNWYALYLICVQFISWLLIFYVLSGRKQPFMHIGYALGLYLFMGPISYSHLQFTTTATIAAVAGMLLVYDSIKGVGINWRKLIAGMVILAITFMIRKHPSAMVVMLCSIPFIRTDRIKGNIKPAAVLASIAVLWVGLFQINNYYFDKDSEWGRHLKEVLSGNRFSDNPAYLYFIGTKDMKEVNGWSQNDFALFNALFRSYDPVYNLESYKKLHDSYSKFRPLQTRDFIYLFRTQFFPAVILLMILFSLYYHRYKERILLILQTLLLAAIAWYIYATFEMKERAILSMVFAYIGGVILINDKIVVTSNRRNRVITTLVILAMVVSGFIFQQKVRNRMAELTQRDREIARSLIALMSKSDVTWIVWGPTLPLESLSPFEYNFTYKDKSPRIFPMASTNKNPLLTERFGGTLHSMLADSNSRVVTLDYPTLSFVPERLDTFYREHLGCELIHGGDSIDQTSGRRIFWFKGCREVNHD